MDGDHDTNTPNQQPRLNDGDNKDPEDRDQVRFNVLDREIKSKMAMVNRVDRSIQSLARMMPKLNKNLNNGLNKLKDLKERHEKLRRKILEAKRNT
jgi:hypothetical protein